jgi:Tfp pilus assembly protein FimT
MRQMFCFSEKKNSAGFTLIEIFLVLATMAILAGISIPIAWPYVMQNELDVSATIVAQSLRRAQSLAMSMQGDSAWGVELEPQAITLYKGDDFGSRDPAYDEVFILTMPFSYDGLTEVYFAKFSGQPNVSGSITMNNSMQQIRRIEVNQKGMVGD